MSFQPSTRSWTVLPLHLYNPWWAVVRLCMWRVCTWERVVLTISSLTIVFRWGTSPARTPTLLGPTHCQEEVSVVLVSLFLLNRVVTLFLKFTVFLMVIFKKAWKISHWVFCGLEWKKLTFQCWLIGSNLHNFFCPKLLWKPIKFKTSLKKFQKNSRSEKEI